MRKLLLALAVLLLTGTARAEYFHIKSYGIDVRLSKDATIDVKETILVNFHEPRHGIFRKIPYRYRVSAMQAEDRAERPFMTGNEYKISIYDVSVTGDTFTESKQGDYVFIKIGSKDRTVNGDKEYVISYKVYGAINFFSKHAEFYWNIIGIDWDVVIENTTFSVLLPESVSLSEDDLFVYSGAYRSRDRKVSHELNDRLLTGATKGKLNPHEAVTVGIKLPYNYLSRGNMLLNLRLWIINNWIWLIPVPVFFILFAFWALVGKNERLADMVFFKPPSDMTSAECGVILDDSTDNNDLISLLFQWGANGYMEIAEYHDDTGIFDKTDFILHKLKDLPPEAKAYERTIFSGLFPAYMESRRVSTLKNEFYGTMEIARKELDAQIDADNCYVPGTREAGKALMGAAGIFVLGVCYFGEWKYLGPVLICAALMVFFGKIMPKKSPVGARKLQAIRGFKEFAERVEMPRLKMLMKEDPLYFESTLPYIIVLGLSTIWAEKFQYLVTAPPSWFRTSGPMQFNTVNFMNAVTTGMSAMNSAFTSKPSAAGSGSSGFGSGGFSGGGFGGGGGGSW